jgi:pyruvate,orthophosphate dikinase
LESPKYVYTFGDKAAEGNAQMKELLGGKGANLAEMSLIGIPVPPGFTITTETCNHYYSIGKEEVISLLREQVADGVKNVEKIVGSKFGDAENPLLLSVRSGARVSMPGMMDTVLNLGINEEVVEGMAKKFDNERLAWDSYRRFVQMYGDVVMGLKPVNKEDDGSFESSSVRSQKRKRREARHRALHRRPAGTGQALQSAAILKETGQAFPTDPWDQLWGAMYWLYLTAG